jgi:hypothetical protein
MARGDMDNDLREALRDIKDSIKSVDAKLETHLIQFSSHCVEDARVQQQILSSSQAAHKRMDEHTEDHKADQAGRVNLWIGVVLAFLSGAIGALFTWFKGGKE